MSETRYIISDAAKMIDVEPHVLRYWEEELGMEIPRNEMGHRYYTDKEVRLFTNVRDLKEKGFQLKAIKMILSTLSDASPASNIISLDDVRKTFSEADELPKALDAERPPHQRSAASDEVPEDKSEMAESALVKAELDEHEVIEALSAEDKMKHFKYIMDSIVMESLDKNNEILEDKITGKVIKEMDYLFRMQEEREEQRFRSIDEIIRNKQKGRKEAAAAKAPAYGTERTKKGLFGKNKNF